MYLFLSKRILPVDQILPWLCLIRTKKQGNISFCLLTYTKRPASQVNAFHKENIDV